MSNDEVIEQLTTWAGRVAAGEAVLLRLIGELDAREAWAVHGVTSCAHWLSWQLGLSQTTASERVRVARALRELPLTAVALAEGRVSYSQVRAISRVATAADETVWVELARHSTGAQLDKAARGAARAKAADQDPASRPEKATSTVSWDDDGDLVLTLRFPAAQAPGVLAALEHHQAAEKTDRDARLTELAVALVGQAGDTAADRSGAGTESSAEDCGAVPQPYVYEEPPYPQLRQRVSAFEARTPAEEQALADWTAERDRRRARRDAWRAHEERLHAEAAAQHIPTGRASLADALVRALLRPSHGPAVKLQLLVDPVSGWARTSTDELLPPTTLAAVLRTLPGQHRLPTARPLQACDLTRHDLGRRSRLVSPTLRALLGQLDGERCRFPSCSHTRFLHAHHVTFWRHGGPTDLANMILLCTRHHTLLHQHGYQLTLDPNRTLHVRTADGTQLLHHLALPHAPAEDLPIVAAGTLPNHYSGDRFDLGYIVNVMLQHAA